MTQEVLFLGRQFRKPAAIGQLEDGIEAGPATQQRNFESRVVRQRRQPAQAPAGLGLLARVFQVAGAVLGDVENDPRISRADQLHRQLAQDRAQLLELARVRRGEQQPLQRSFSAFFWVSTSSAAPLTASLSICSISSGLNGSCSAVPWISMKRPSSASTQFMSVWAAKSSR